MPVNVDTKSLAGKYLPSVYVSEISIKEGGTLRLKKKDKASIKEKSLFKDSKKKTRVSSGKTIAVKKPRKSKTEKSLTINLDMVIRDVIEKDAISTWMANSDFTKFLKIKIIQSTSPKLTKMLSKGRTDAVRAPRFKKHAAVRILSVQKDNFDLKDYIKIHSSDGERIYEIPYETTMLVEGHKPDHLSYFIFTFLDIQEMAQSYGLKFDEKKKFIGQISEEPVIINKEVKTTSEIYYLSETNQVWSGKVHKKSGQWFTGTQRTRTPRPLNKQRITNGKIKDYRDVNDVGSKKIEIKPALKTFQRDQKKQLNRDMVPPKVSASYISQGTVSPKQNGDTSIIFHVDVRKWIREQSAFGTIIQNSTNKRAVEEIYFLSKIKNLKVIRRRINKTSSINKLGTNTTSLNFDPSRQIVETIVYSADKNGFLKKKKTKQGAIREIQNLAFTNNVRTFTAEDKSMKDITDGLYQYGVEIEAIDGTVVFLNKRLNRLIAAKKELDLYYNDAICPKYISPNGKFKPTLSKKYKRLNKRPWSAAIAVYLDVYTSLSRLPRNRKIMARKLFSMTNPASGTESGIYGLLTMVEQLINQVTAALGSKRMQSYTLNTRMSINSDSTSRASGGAKTAKQFKVSTLSMNKYFRDTHDSNLPKNFGIDFLGNQGVQDIGTRAILFSDFDNRIDQENSIYWKDSISAASNILKSEAEEEAQAPDMSPILNLEAVEYGYLTPSTISAGPITLNRMDAGQSIWSPEQYNTITSTVVSINSGSPPSTNSSTMTRPEDPEDSESNTISMTRPNPYDKTTIKSGNDIGKQASDSSKNNLLAQLGVVIVEPTEENLEEFSSLSTATKKKLLISVDKILDPLDPLNSISEEACNNQLDTDNKQISERKRSDVKKRNSENKSAVADVFINNLASSGVLNPSNTTQSSPFAQPTIMPIEDYDLTTSKNVVDSIRKSPLKKAQIEGIPNQMRSLMFSRSDSTKNNWLDQNQDPLKSPETSQMMRYNYGTFGKIEVFMGFKKDKHGNNIILKPIFKMLNKSIIKRANGNQLMCRIENYKNKALGIGDNSLDMRIFDNCFIMSPSEVLATANKAKYISKRQKALEDGDQLMDSQFLTGIPSAEVTIGKQLFSMKDEQRLKLERSISKGGSDQQIAEIVADMVKVEDTQKLMEAATTGGTEVMQIQNQEYIQQPTVSEKTQTMTRPKEEETIEEILGPSVEEEMLEEMAKQQGAQEAMIEYSNSTVKGTDRFEEEQEEEWGFLPNLEDEPEESLFGEIELQPMNANSTTTSFLTGPQTFSPGGSY